MTQIISQHKNIEEGQLYEVVRAPGTGFEEGDKIKCTGFSCDNEAKFERLSDGVNQRIHPRWTKELKEIDMCSLDCDGDIEVEDIENKFCPNCEKEIADEAYQWNGCSHKWELETHLECPDCGAIKEPEQEDLQIDAEIQLAISIAISEADVDGVDKATENVIEIVKNNIII